MIQGEKPEVSKGGGMHASREDADPTGQVWALFNEVVDLDESERESMLAQARHVDAAALVMVRQLLALDRELAGSTVSAATKAIVELLDEPTPDSRLVGLADPNAPLGLHVGPFVLERWLGSGGMGVVWLAEQVMPLRRQVALKVLAGHDDGPMAQTLFELERQSLARLSHRSIAQIYEAGRLPDGSLFFAMEYVPGPSLDQFVRAQRPDLRSLATLMIELCQGVQHAHQRNLIHRDIKPGNILVLQIDGVSLPKLIDFGIAANSQATQPLHGGGTRGYMPPEQSEPGPASLDQRTDVYGLGAVLAECLCILAGLESPAERFDSARARTVLQQTLDGRVPDAAAPDRRAALDRLRRQPAELRSIARKALAPDREQRYDTADALAQDLRCWLEARPVTALPATRTYFVRCLLRRHAMASIAATVVLFAVLTGLGLALYGLREAGAQREVAEQRRDDAERLIQFMLGDLAGRLRPLGRLDLLDAVAKEAMAYVGRQAAPTDARTALHQAQALRTLAGVQLGREQNAAASATLEQAAHMLAPWLGDTEDVELHILAGEIAFRRGRLAYAARDFDAASRFWEANLRHARQVQAAAPDSAKSRTTLANALQNLAVLEVEGHYQWASAITHLDDVIGLLSTRQSPVAPVEPGAAAFLANAWFWKALAQLELGQSKAAWRSMQLALVVLGQPSAGQDDSFRQLVEFEMQTQRALLAADMGLDKEAAAALHRAYEMGISQAGLEEAENPKSKRRLARVIFLEVLHSPGPRPADLGSRLARANACLSTPACWGADAEPARQLELRSLGTLANLEAGLPIDVAAAGEILDAGLADAAPTAARLRVLVRLGKHVALTDARRRSMVDAVARMAPELRASLRYQLLQFEMLALLDPQSGELKALADRIDRDRRDATGPDSQ